MAQTNILPMSHAARNAGVGFDLDWIEDVRINLSASERRVASLPGRRSVKKDAQAAWLLKAVTCIDLTTLSGDDTASPGAPALRQGEAADPRRYSGKAGHLPTATSTRAPSVFITALSPPPLRRLRAAAFRLPPFPPAFRRGSFPMI